MPVLLIRYAYASDLPPAEQNAVEKHLQHCAECRELVAFIRQTQGVARSERSTQSSGHTPECLDVDTIALLEEGHLTSEVEERAREHILNCARCRDQYLLWCKMNAEEPSVRPDQEAENRMPLSEIEHRLAAIWRDVLNLDHVDLNDNFFEIGGSPLIATQILWRIRVSFDVQVPLQAFQEHPTVAGLAREIPKYPTIKIGEKQAMALDRTFS
jgi:acyl carrier protein